MHHVAALIVAFTLVRRLRCVSCHATQRFDLHTVYNIQYKFNTVQCSKTSIMATPRPTIDRAASDANVRNMRKPESRLSDPYTQSLNPNSDSSGELAAVVDDLLSQLNSKFSQISSELLSKSKIGTSASYGDD
jgi:hypothetical protein